jgi:hypothetical protein
VSALQSGLIKRFGDILSFDDFRGNSKIKALVIASTSHPYFKLRWCPSDHIKQQVEELFLEEVVRLNSCTQANETVSQHNAGRNRLSDDMFEKLLLLKKNDLIY